MTLLMVYLALVNLVAFVLFGMDKRRARLDQWRIKESTLLLSAALGGGVGALAGMRLWHHKTRKAKFAIGVPVMLALWMVGIGLIVILFG